MRQPIAIFGLNPRLTPDTDESGLRALLTARPVMY